MKMMSSSSCALLIGALFAAGLVTGCRSRTTPPEREPPSSSAASRMVASAAPSAAPNASAPVEAKVAPTYTLERFAPGKSSPDGLYRIGGALVVTEGLQVSRLVGETLEPIGKIPPGGPALGEHIINEVFGQWPDWVGVQYQNTQGRAAEPSFIMVKGKGVQHIMGEGGQPGGILGLATVGETTLLATFDSRRDHYLSVARGPRVTYKMQGMKQAGCKVSDARSNPIDALPPAIIPYTLAASPAGTLISIGNHCDNSGTAAEVWGKDGTSRIVDLHEMVHGTVYRGESLAGQGDELWLLLAGDIVHYKDGAFEPVPAPTGNKTRSIFLSPQGKLHTSDGEAIHRRDGDRWALLGRFDWPTNGKVMMDEQGKLWMSYGSVYQLRERPGLDASSVCATPMVYLYEPTVETPANFTFPTTRKALASFAESSSLGLVDFRGGGSRRLGVKVTSAAQGEALIAHLRTAMKDERPRLMCLDPASPRVIPLGAK